MIFTAYFLYKEVMSVRLDVTAHLVEESRPDLLREIASFTSVRRN